MWKRTLLAASLGLNLLFVAVGTRAVINRGGWKYLAQRKPTTPQASPIHIQRTAMFAGLTPRAASLVFFGDSLIENCEWNELLLDPSAINRGIGGDTTAELLPLVPSIADSAPKSVFIMAGVNDLRMGVPMPLMIERYRAIITGFRKGHPNVRVYVHSILPVNPGLDESLRPLPESIRIANRDLSQLALEEHCEFVNLHLAVADSSDFLDRKYTPDGLHLNAAGYRVWESAIHSVSQPTAVRQ